MENYISNPLAGLLQHTLRSFCHEKSLWIYAVFWRTLPRIYPPPNWDDFGLGANKRTREYKKNWMLAWEDGFCNFFAENCDAQHYYGITPNLFFKMSHEIHNYGEGVIGKVAAQRGHICIHSEENNLSTLQNSEDLHPRTWGAQFQSGIKTIALIAVDEGVLQLGAIKKVPEDLNYAEEVQKKFNYLLKIPGFLLPHPSYSTLDNSTTELTKSSIQQQQKNSPETTQTEFINQNELVMMTTPSMTSLETLLLKLPAVVPPLFHFNESSSSPWLLSCNNNNNNNNNNAVDQEIANHEKIMLS